MKTTRFGKSGYDVSPIGFGGAEIGFLKQDREQVALMLNQLLDRGVNVIDTAAMYASSEALIGEAIGHRRNEYVLISKCGTKVDDIRAPEWSPKLITESVDRALRNLQTDHLDVMLLHSCDLEVLKQGDALGALIQARDAGKIRHAGYSGDNQPAVYAASLPDVAVIETSINICDQANIGEVLPICRENDLGVIAKRPLANACWKDLDQQPGMYQNYAKTYTERLDEMGLTPSDLGFGGPADDAWPEIAIRFTLSQPGVHTAIIGTTNPKHAQANIAAAEQGPLDEHVVEMIYAAFTQGQGAAVKAWSGQT